MSNGDVISEVRQELGLGDDRTKIDLNEALPVLQRLAKDIERSQRAIGFILWNMDPSPMELRKIAEMLDLSVETLRSWMNTYSRLRESHALLAFSLQQQLARIQDQDAREALWSDKPEGEWTLVALKDAVEDWLLMQDTSGMPKTKKAGCRANLNGRQVKVNLELLKDSVIVKLTVSEGNKLRDMKFDEVSEGIYQVKFDW